MARLFGDENFPRPVMARLREAGHDVDGVQERGLGGIRLPDHLPLAGAAADGRAVLTTNGDDFERLHRSAPVSSSAPRTGTSPLWPPASTHRSGRPAT